MSGQEAILARCAAGDISPQIAIAQILLAGETPDVAALVGAPAGSPLARVATLIDRHRDAFATMTRIAGGGLDPVGDDPVAGTAALFDRLAREAPEAAVAFYSLGDQALLDEATAELVAIVEAWSPLTGRRVVDLGCGIGRVAIAVAPRAAHVLALDVSAGMVAEARGRTADLANVRVEQVGGRDLAGVADASVDLVLAADILPFVVAAGEDVVDRYLAEVARVIRPGGDLLVFNWSYRGDPARDIADAHALADRHGFAVRRAGEQPFVIWDGVGFQLTRQ